MRPVRTLTGTTQTGTIKFTWDRSESMKRLHETGTNSDRCGLQIGLHTNACFCNQGVPALTIERSRLHVLSIFPMFSRACYTRHVFQCSTDVACFPSLATSYMLSHDCNTLHAFPRLQYVTCSPTLVTNSMFFCACRTLHVFPRLQHVACFPALVGTVFLFILFIYKIRHWWVKRQ